MFNCPRCKKEFDSYKGMSRHTAKSYKLSGEALYREYHCITTTPTCKCGCGLSTKWRIDRGYGEYVTGHNSKGKSNPMYGKAHTENARKNISQKRKEKFANGEYTFINSDVWSKSQKKVWEQDGYREKMKFARENKGWREKLSKAKTGENNPFYGKKRPDHSKLMKSPEMMEKIFSKRSMTDIEQIVADMLNQLQIDYHSQFFLVDDEQTYAYDFKLKGLSLLIEVDGDYWHGGPAANIHVPYVQDVKEKDDIKTVVAQKYGYTVVRFWGSDVKTRPFWVIQELLAHINSPV